MTVEQLFNAGVALFGPRWQREMGRALGMSQRAVRWWLATGRLPADLALRVDAVFARRIGELEAGRRELGQGVDIGD